MASNQEHRPNGQLPAFNPIDGQAWTVVVREARTTFIRERRIGPARELIEIVPPTLLRPTAVYRGLRDRDSLAGLCYVGSPTKAYDFRTGQRVPPWPGKVFLVFVSDQRVVYNWRWEKASPDNPTLPEGYATRFTERLHYRDQF